MYVGTYCGPNPAVSTFLCILSFNRENSYETSASYHLLIPGGDMKHRKVRELEPKATQQVSDRVCLPCLGVGLQGLCSLHMPSWLSAIPW
jgi:hypothetical protein